MFKKNRILAFIFLASIFLLAGPQVSCGGGGDLVDCVVDEDCAQGEYCNIFGECQGTQSCDSNADCNNGEECENDFCVVPN